MPEINNTPFAASLLQATMQKCMAMHHQFVMPEHMLSALLDDSVFLAVIDYYADLVVVEPGETRVTHESILYKCGWSPLEGQTFHTRIRQVFLNGMPASQSSAMKLNIKS